MGGKLGIKLNPERQRQRFTREFKLEAVRQLELGQADQPVAQVMKTLAETFSKERANLEAQLDQKDKASTENLRLELRRCRSFFERLLLL